MPLQYTLFIAFHNSKFLILPNFKVGENTRKIYLNFLLNDSSCYFHKHCNEPSTSVLFFKKESFLEFQIPLIFIICLVIFPSLSIFIPASDKKSASKTSLRQMGRAELMVGLYCSLGVPDFYRRQGLSFLMLWGYTPRHKLSWGCMRCWEIPGSCCCTRSTTWTFSVLCR